ncbi:ABC transporter substrate-binding protein [Arthrobacter sp. Sa2BUA2]|uniref:ABC transporter substrate-binding protein n=1 Tax=Arthrobacter pullicola TaxID=2762224 RepID=A0ABR8YDQ6_9MICC|nr:ABC transporter substrate-binding protein [Arthrobacter pullicola]MBD8042340.1 ABC transporter substrate-binding protein [Arthrobacter pullicola]
MKRSKTGALGALLLGVSLAATGCGGDTAAGSSDTVRIGISQLVEHPSLDQARKGFIRALEENGYTEGENLELDIQNASGDQATATTIASSFASDGKDLVLAIATPAAQAAAQAITEVPVLFTAVTEPEVAGLVDSWDSPGANITGTSDLNPVKEQIGLIKELAPDAKSVGIVYSSGEVNSDVQVELAQEAAKELGLEVKLATVSNSAEVQQATESLDVDAIYVPTDNNVVTALQSVIQIAEAKQLPVVVGEGDSVEKGGVATYGLDYESLGYQTGLMALKILEDGADPASMPVETLTEIQLIINKSAAANMGIEIPAAMLDKADKVIE